MDVKGLGRTQRVHVASNWVLWILVLVIVVQVFAKYTFLGYLDIGIRV